MQAVLQFTASQKDDLSHLRRIFHGKLGQLARQRTDILQRMSNSELSLRNIEDIRDGGRHTQLEELAVQLRQNGMEDYRTHVQCTAIMYDGVSTPLSPCLTISLSIC